MDVFIAELSTNGTLINIKWITDGPGQKARPRFSADGKWLVYTSGSGGINDEYPLLSLILFTPQFYGEIYAYRLDDGLLVRLTHDKWEDGAPFWVPALTNSE